MTYRILHTVSDQARRNLEVADARYRITNARTGRTLATRVALAATASSRARGLLGRDSLDRGEGLWIEPCSAVHMFFMRFAIDAVFTDRERRVVRTVAGLRPWRIALGGWSARAVLEVSIGTIEA
ncbi:MAG: DUF192 domain-containing protein, partial [Candidatus Binatia bacterium]